MRHSRSLYALFFFVFLIGVSPSRFFLAGSDDVVCASSQERMARDVLQNLLSSPLGKLAPQLRYSVTLVNSRYPNAYSNHQGKVYITWGLSPVLDDDAGVWAAVIGHELGHIILHHPDSLPRFEAGLRQDYQKACSEGEDGGPSQWPGVKLGERISRFKLSRNEELQADFIGLMLMAEAGYQPGFALLLDQRLRYGLGDVPGIMAIFSHHPRLETREEHIRKFYDIAMSIFQYRWPNVANSPGGNLPPYGAIEHWEFHQEDRGTELVFQVPFQVHNAEGMQVRVAAFFLDHDRRVPTANPQYRAIDGSLVLNAFLPGGANKAGEVTLRVPRSALGTHENNLLAVVFLMAGKRPLAVVKTKVDLAGK
jgi:hypothetical protein